MTDAVGSAPEATAGRAIVIGLTGPIASGKSTVARMLADYGAKVIDADAVYRSLLSPRSELSRQLIERFGNGIADANGGIDRAALGARVFSDAVAMADLDRLTHPVVVSEIRHLIDAASSPVVVEAIKLAQSGLLTDIDSLWVVTAEPRSRLKRLMTRSGLDEAHARQRLAKAVDPALSEIEPDIIIDNSGSLQETARQVVDAWTATVATARSGRSLPMRRVQY